MDSMHQAIYKFINTCPLVGHDMYFNIVSQDNPDNNTALLIATYGELVQKYVDGDKVMKMQCEIRQIKPCSLQPNTAENVEQLDKVQEFLDWINSQNKNNNLPNFGTDKIVEAVKTPDGVANPIPAANYEGTTLFAFPFEVIYYERN